VLLAQTSPLRHAPGTTRSADFIEPSPEEAANGWTPETLTEFHAQAMAAEHQRLMKRLFPDKPPLRMETVAGFDPHSW
jgi:hypothetical protein